MAELLFVAGVVGRVLVPYAVARLYDNRLRFNWRFAPAQLVAAVVIWLLWPPVGAAAFPLGWFACDVGRETWKVLMWGRERWWG